jgi:hypothetical protein
MKWMSVVNVFVPPFQFNHCSWNCKIGLLNLLICIIFVTLCILMICHMYMRDWSSNENSPCPPQLYQTWIKIFLIKHFIYYFGFFWWGLPRLDRSWAANSNRQRSSNIDCEWQGETCKQAESGARDIGSDIAPVRWKQGRSCQQIS